MITREELLKRTAEELSEGNITQNQADNFIKILDGEKLIPLFTDLMAKMIFSPDLHPDRFDYIMQNVLDDAEIISDGSMTNEPPLKSKNGKKMIFDISSWLTDGRAADLEFQTVAQQYIFNRMDIYTSGMLMLQFSTEDGQLKKEVNYKNAKGVVSVVLMRKSPRIFKGAHTGRYIHRIKTMDTDTGISFPTLRQIAFVQLDVALEQFITKTYNKDEDIELLTLLAMIADINNEVVIEAAKNSDMFKGIYEEVKRFSGDKEVQAEMLQELKYELDELDYNANISDAIDEGAEIFAEILAQLKKEGRAQDAEKAIVDQSYRKKLMNEYKKEK